MLIFAFKMINYYKTRLQKLRLKVLSDWIRSIVHFTVIDGNGAGVDLVLFDTTHPVFFMLFSFLLPVVYLKHNFY